MLKHLAGILLLGVFAQASCTLKLTVGYVWGRNLAKVLSLECMFDDEIIPVYDMACRPPPQPPAHCTLGTQLLAAGGARHRSRRRPGSRLLCCMFARAHAEFVHTCGPVRVWGYAAAAVCGAARAHAALHGLLASMPQVSQGDDGFPVLSTRDGKDKTTKGRCFIIRRVPSPSRPPSAQPLPPLPAAQCCSLSRGTAGSDPPTT